MSGSGIIFVRLLVDKDRVDQGRVSKKKEKRYD